MLVKWQFISMKNYLNLTVFVIFCSRQMLNPCNLDTSKVSLWYRYFQTVPRILNTVDLKKKNIEKSVKQKKVPLSIENFTVTEFNNFDDFYPFLNLLILCQNSPEIVDKRIKINSSAFIWNGISIISIEIVIFIDTILKSICEK